MVELVKQIIDYYLKFKKEPELKDLNITDNTLTERAGNVFVTIYLKGEINGSSGNIKEIEGTIAEEVIKNTINAISRDPRFEPLTEKDLPNIKIRVDEIVSRQVLKEGEIKTLEPIKKGVIAIKKDYETLVVILPNISPSIINGNNLKEALATKLGAKNFEEKDYIVYSIDTEVSKDF